MTTFTFTAEPTRTQQEAFVRHMGARRFAYNQCLALWRQAVELKQTDPSLQVPESAYSLINAFNAWKRSAAAGRAFAVGSDGTTEVVATGLIWRKEVCAQVMEEAAVDFARALAAWRGAKGTGRKTGFPRPKKKGRARDTFRLRNKVSSSGTPSIRVGDGRPRSITLPVLGCVKVREDTRRLRRLLRGDRGRICLATVTGHRGRFRVTLTLEAADFCPERRHPEAHDQGFVGVDLGLRHFLVAASSDGRERARLAPPRAHARSLRALQRASKRASRRQRGSTRRRKADDRLKMIHAEVADRRRDFLHKSSTTLVKTHARLCVEDLSVRALVQNRHLARSIADAGWGRFLASVRYKADWYGAEVVVAPRSFPSTRTCSACGWKWAEMTLSERTFRCRRCGLVLDRDLNAAINLAAWADAGGSPAYQAPDPEAPGRVNKARGGIGAGRHAGAGGTGPGTVGEHPTRKREPARPTDLGS